MAKNKVMTAVISLAGVIDPSLSKSLSDAQKKLGGLNLKAIGVGGAVAGATALTGKAVFGAVKAGVTAVKNFGVAATDSAGQFQKQMSNVATLLDGDVNGRIAELNDEVLKVSNRTGIATADLTDGLYQVVSAFGDTAESSKTLEIAAKAAKAGNATTTDSINLLSAVTKGYGDTSAAAQQKAADLAFQTVKLGQTTFPELAASMGKVIPLAKTMGVTQEELFGATATLTGVTGNTAEVMTQLRGTIQGFLQPSTAMTKAMTSLGYADGQAMLQANGLQGTLDVLKESVGGNEIAFSNLFGSVEAKNAVLALAGEQADNFTQKTEAMRKASGAAGAAFSAQTNNLDDMRAKMENMKGNFMTKVGMTILPIVQQFAETAMPYVEQFLDQTGAALEGIAPVLSEVAAVLVPLLSETLSSILPPIVDTIKLLVPPFSEIVKALMPPLVKLVLAVLPLLEPLLKLLEPIANILGKIVEWVAGIVGKGADVIAGIASFFSGKKAPAAEPAVPTGFARGGFTRGTSLAGEDPGHPVEAVISFNPAYREQNLRYWERAGQMLGAPAVTPERGIPAVMTVGPVVSALAAGKPLSNIAGETKQVVTVNPVILTAFAAGGFTQGPSLAGEDPGYPTEAVISFNPAYRSQNLTTWARAGQMLNATPDDAPDLLGGGSRTVVRQASIGNLTFAPQITTHQNDDEEGWLRQVRRYEPEFREFVLDVLNDWEEGTYSDADPWED